MSKIAYQDRKFGAAAIELIDQVNTICESYARQGYGLTLRGLYYQLVTQNVLVNSQQSYKRLGNVVSEGRVAGLIDWNHITDTGRTVHSPSFWSDPESIIESAARSYNIEMWRNQPEYVEVWVEKEALANVIGRAANRRDSTYFACKGYTSQSEMWSAAMRLKAHERRGQRTTVIHLGDHDPSGHDPGHPRPAGHVRLLSPGQAHRAQHGPDRAVPAAAQLRQGHRLPFRGLPGPVR
jgi:hypothetical protein